jgi:hypothetical protein
MLNHRQQLKDLNMQFSVTAISPSTECRGRVSAAMIVD